MEGEKIAREQCRALAFGQSMGMVIKCTSRVVLKCIPQGRVSLDIAAQTDNSVDDRAASSKCNFALIKF